GQGLGARIAEFDPRLGIGPAAAERNHGALAEAPMAHSRTDTEALLAHRDAGRLGAGGSRRERAARLALPIPQAAPKRTAPGRPGCGLALTRSDPFQVLFRNFVQEARTHAVARLAMQHAALRQGQGQAP